LPDDWHEHGLTPAGDRREPGIALMPLQTTFFASPARLRPGRAEIEGVKTSAVNETSIKPSVA